jgi:hypothetical protein
MKAKHVKMHLQRKFNAWLASIEDEKLREQVQQNTIITGGAIVSLLLDEKVNDYDIYFRNIETAKAVAEYYVEKYKKSPHKTFNNDEAYEPKVVITKDKRLVIYVKSVGAASESDTPNYQFFEQVRNPESVETEEFIEAIVQDLKEDKEEGEKQPYRPIFLSANAITLSDKIQLVIRFYGEPDEIHENYDFVHCTNYWTSWDNHLELRAAALEALLARELRYIGSKYPICSVIRTRKFLKKGWMITAGQYLKMCMQVSELDLTDPKVLQDQLIGVDTAYFTQLINTLQEQKMEKVDSTYIALLVDEIF